MVGAKEFRGFSGFSLYRRFQFPRYRVTRSGMRRCIFPRKPSLQPGWSREIILSAAASLTSSYCASYTPPPRNASIPSTEGSMARSIERPSYAICSSSINDAPAKRIPGIRTSACTDFLRNRVCSRLSMVAPLGKHHLLPSSPRDGKGGGVKHREMLQIRIICITDRLKFHKSRIRV